jgi:hypothetical protein
MSEAATDMPTDEVPTDDPGDPVVGTAQDHAQERAREGLDHLQAAARELIAAARAALDVAEDLIDDPDTISSVVGAAGQFGGLGDLVRSLFPTRRAAQGEADVDADGGRGGSVQRIEVL